jgi:nitrogen regulatory protein P-II 1
VIEMMKEIKAFVRPSETDPIVHGLESIGVGAMTITTVDALGTLVDEQHRRLSTQYVKRYSCVHKIEIVCREEDVDRIVSLIRRVGHTGEPGDGIIYVSGVERAVKIRTGGEDAAALDGLPPSGS